MESSAKIQDLLFDVRESVARITINRPDARNAFTFEMYEELARLCGVINKDNSIKAVIVTGAGEKAFSSGTDISCFRDFKTAEDALRYESFMDRVLNALETIRVPTIAAITGACTGGGAAIATCCDLRISTRDIKFGFPIARTLGNCLSMGNLARLSALLGPARVKELIFTARLIEAEEALSLGLVSNLVGDRVELDAEVTILAQKIAGFAPLTLRATKEGLHRLRARGHASDDTDLILMCYMSQDFREGMDAFLRKRPPQWKGE